MSERKIHFENDEVWTYKPGETHVLIRDPLRKTNCIPYTDLLGLSWDAVEKGIHKRWLQVTPQIVKDYIAENLRNV